MTFRELLASHDAKELWYILSMRHNLPPIRAERLFEGYFEAREEMLSLPIVENAKGTFVCLIYADELHGGAPEISFDTSITYEGDCEKYAFEFTDWAELIDCKVDEECLRKYGPLVVTAELFWEMTFCGYSRESVAVEADKLKKALDEVKCADNGEIKGIPAEEVFAKLHADIDKRKNSQDELNAKEWFLNAPVSVKKSMFRILKHEALGTDSREIDDSVFAEIIRVRAEKSTYKYAGCDTAGAIIYAMAKSLDYDEMYYLIKLLQTDG